MTSGLAARLPIEVPVDPDSPEARDWLIRELSDPRYVAAQPTWLDRLASQVLDWLSSLLGEAGPGAPPGFGGIVIVLIIVGAVIAAYFLFGPPRVNRRSRSAATLFGVDDERSSDDLRTAARAAAAQGDWAVAIEEMFRATARGLGERSVLEVSPGTTAAGFAARASDSFPALGERLTASATVFDSVRYLGADGTPAQFESVATLDRDIRAATPTMGAAPVGSSGITT